MPTEVDLAKLSLIIKPLWIINGSSAISFNYNLVTKNSDAFPALSVIYMYSMNEHCYLKIITALIHLMLFYGEYLNMLPLKTMHQCC